MASHEEPELEELNTEIADANNDVATATKALAIVIGQLSDTKRLLKRYMTYFKIAVGIGALAVIIAVSAAFAQYHFNQQLEKNQAQIEREADIREYEDCLRTNEGRSDVIDVLITIATFGDDIQTEREDAIIAAVKERIPLANCSVLHPDREN